MLIYLYAITFTINIYFGKIFCINCSIGNFAIQFFAFFKRLLYHLNVMETNLWKQFQTTQTVVRRPVAGRPIFTTPAKINILLLSPNGIAEQTWHVWHVWLQSPLVRRYLQLLYAEDYIGVDCMTGYLKFVFFYPSNQKRHD